MTKSTETGQSPVRTHNVDDFLNKTVKVQSTNVSQLGHKVKPDGGDYGTMTRPHRSR